MTAAFQLTKPGTDVRLTQQGDILEADGHCFSQLDHGIWDLTPPEFRLTLDRFAQDYARVREAEGRALSPDQVRSLPSIEPDHASAWMWGQRASSFAIFQRWLRRRPNLPTERTVVDIGAGCGWLAANLARDHWHAAAVDITVEGGDGLAAARHHHEDLMLVRAEMGALPFASNSVDLAVFNASLHYAADVRAALAEARRIVRPAGYLAVIDSPTFHDVAAGQEMVQDFAVAIQRTYGIAPAEHLGPGFVAWSDVEHFGLKPIVRSGVRARFHQWRGARISGREVAQRPQLVAQCVSEGVAA